MQLQLGAACNALHPVKARMGRWMLHLRDHSDDDMLPLTQETLSQILGVRRTTVTLLMRSLRASGAITGFSVTVDPGMLGWTTEAYVELFCRGRTSPSDIAAAVSKYPEVTGAATITGEADALLHIRAADVRHFEEVVEHISAEPFVVRTKSVIVLSRLVSRAGFGPVGSQPPGGGPAQSS